MDYLRCQQTQQATADSSLNQFRLIRKKSNRMIRQKGFITIILLPLMMALMAGFSGLSLMSLGIKNLTRSQSLCITENIHGQKKLGELLTRLLKLNRTVTRLQNTKRALQVTLASAIALGQIQVISTLRKKISMIKKYQKHISLKQKYILMKSELIRKMTFKNLKIKLKAREIKNIQEKIIFKKALAVSKKSLDSHAHTYQPLPDFTKQQTIAFSWEINPFFKQKLYELLPFYFKKSLYIKKRCAATLKNQRGQWTAQLTH